MEGISCFAVQNVGKGKETGSLTEAACTAHPKTVIEYGFSIVHDRAERSAS